MLKQRVITALILLALLVPAMLAENPLAFEVLTLVLMSAGAWEWSRLQGLGQGVAVVSGLMLGLLLAVSHWLASWGVDTRVVAWLGLVMWLPGVVWMVSFGLTHWGQAWRPLRLLLGWLAVALAWWSMVSLKLAGLNQLLSVLTLVWAADIAAYFGGRAFGKRKLAPSISPGKTWAGAISGAAAVMVLGTLWVWADAHWALGSNSVYTLLWQRSPAWCLMGVTVLVAFSILGDLVESLVKRVAGVKDSSGLLPGHGGVLDRVDALLPVLPVALWMTLV